jgi:hypothetical protein
MATQLYFSRDTKCYIEFKDVVWEMPILDGYSFSQSNNTSEISLSEMESSGGVSRRGRRAFNDSLSAGEWSFSTYVRPFTATGAALGTGSADTAEEVHAVEEVLWAMMAGSDTYTGAAFTRTTDAVTGPVITPAANSSAITFAESNRSTFQTANIYFVLGDANRTVIKLKDAVVNEASIDFEIDGIATINWSGQCSEVLDFSGSTIEDTAIPVDTDVTRDSTGSSDTVAVGDVWLDSDDSYRLYVLTAINNGAASSHTTYVNEALTDSDNFIRNRLTQLSINGAGTTGLLAGANAYSLTLTGGNITISNNVTYITPEELGVVNVPIGHVTGGRAVSGSFTCYLSLDSTAMDGTGNLSRDFFEDVRSLTSTVTNSVDLTFKIGGSNGRRLELNFPTAHVEIPTHSIEDVISLETNFMALPSTIDGTNEVSITYKV